MDRRANHVGGRRRAGAGDIRPRAGRAGRGGVGLTGAADPHSGRLRLSWAEISGSLGDLGLFLPLVVAVTVEVGLDLGVVLLAAGAANVLSGLLFRQPIPAQPMKAIAAVAITEGLTGGALAASGLLLGALLVALALTGAIDAIGRLVPKAVVRGIQLGIGLKLAAKGAAWVAELPVLAWDSILVAVLAAGVLVILAARRLPVLVPLFAAGFVLLLIESPGAYEGLGITLPSLGVIWPAASDLGDGFLRGALPQLPLTLLNSVIAVCALSADYFPGRGVAPRKMALAVGVVNLGCAPFGAIPLCFGAGGLAAQHRFGARTGGSVIFLGTALIAVGLLLGHGLLPVLEAYPRSILGTMLLFSGVELARAVRDVVDRRALVVALVTAACILGVNAGVGFLAGVGVHLATRRGA